MIAQRIVGLLPALDPVTALEATMIHSAAGVPLPANGLVRRPTFRAPHHSSSMVSLVGGGSTTMRPGEISLAHGGALFLDELGEFPSSVLDALRQPLEEGVVRVTRANIHTTVPARFLLVAATNPCPCGGGPPGDCECDEGAKARYMRRLSEPLLDRFDLRVGVQRTSVDDLVRIGGGEGTAVVRERVDRARAAAMARAGRLNAAIPPDRVDELAPVTADASALLRRELERGRLSGRGYHRIRRVARTIADLGMEPGARTRDPSAAVPEVVEEHHVSLALRFRVSVGSSARRRVA
jgi:magnesium chelatase family protein